jgi:predicted unusual protein kinase regulating ubiquinone biosynthesis (AarF/ABC1/UbiB family)
VAAEFRKPFPTLFAAFDPAPLASASVAQVHKATLTSPSPSLPGGNKDVVVKVQHKGIAQLMASDMIAAARCFRVVAWLNNDFNLLLR